MLAANGANCLRELLNRWAFVSIKHAFVMLDPAGGKEVGEEWKFLAQKESLNDVVPEILVV